MANRKSLWQNSEIAMNFLQGVRGAIPSACLQLEIADHIMKAWSPKPKRIVDSDPMLNELRKKLEGVERATVIKADFSSKSWTDSFLSSGKPDAVVSGFAIHHQPDQRKRELYAEIYKALNDGGVFLNLEHVASENRNVENLFDEYFIDCLHRFHAGLGNAKAREAISASHYSRSDKAENILASVQVQTEWLRNIGFSDVDCFFKIFEIALFGGRKANAGIAR
jgi:ubiquinone/menaquinone biosynthesis C-methylase UbiE